MSRNYLDATLDTELQSFVSIYFFDASIHSLVINMNNLGEEHHKELQIEMSNIKSEAHHLLEDTKDIK